METESLRIQGIARKQNQAPALELTYDISLQTGATGFGHLIEAWKPEPGINWNITLLVDLSSLFSAAGKRDTISERINTSIINDRILLLEKQRTAGQAFYESRIRDLSGQLQSARQLILNTRKQLTETELLMTSGAITRIEYKAIQVELINRTTLYANIEDELWFYRFLSLLSWK